jgi:hypothetical protein
MASAEAFRPITTVEEPSIQGMPRTYTSKREAAAEAVLPVRGAALPAVWGFVGHIVLTASSAPSNGKVYHVVSHCVAPPWPVLYGSTTEREIDISIPYSQQVVVTPAANEVDDDPLVEYTPIDEAKSIKKTTLSPKAALLDVHYIFPTTESVSLPDTLLTAGINVIRTTGNGDGRAAGSSTSFSTESSIQLSADLFYEIKEGYRGPVPGEVHVFFLDLGNVTAEAIMTKCGASPWPTYQPTSVRVTISGNGLRKSFHMSRSDGSTSASESSGVEAFSNVGVIPATIHGDISFPVTYHDHVAPHTWVADRYEAIEGMQKIILEECIKNAQAGYGMYWGITSTYEAGKKGIEAIMETAKETFEFMSDLKPADFVVNVLPASVGATSPSQIIPGKYITDSSISLYGYGVVKVTASVADITSIL